MPIRYYFYLEITSLYWLKLFIFKYIYLARDLTFILDGLLLIDIVLYTCNYKICSFIKYAPEIRTMYVFL